MPNGRGSAPASSDVRACTNPHPLRRFSRLRAPPTASRRGRASASAELMGGDGCRSDFPQLASADVGKFARSRSSMRQARWLVSSSRARPARARLRCRRARLFASALRARIRQARPPDARAPARHASLRRLSWLRFVAGDAMRHVILIVLGLLAASVPPRARAEERPTLLEDHRPGSRAGAVELGLGWYTDSDIGSSIHVLRPTLGARVAVSNSAELTLDWPFAFAVLSPAMGDGDTSFRTGNPVAADLLHAAQRPRLLPHRRRDRTAARAPRRRTRWARASSRTRVQPP